MSLKKSAGVDNTARRTWDKAEYEDKAQEREVQVSSLDQGRGSVCVAIRRSVHLGVWTC